MHSTDLPPTPEGRLSELAAILARGLLRLNSRPHIHPTAIEPAAPEVSSESSRNSLDFPDTARRDRRTG